MVNECQVNTQCQSMSYKCTMSKYVIQMHNVKVCHTNAQCQSMSYKYTMSINILHISRNAISLCDSLVVECWVRIQEVPDSIASRGPGHTKDVKN